MSQPGQAGVIETGRRSLLAALAVLLGALALACDKPPQTRKPEAVVVSGQLPAQPRVPVEVDEPLPPGHFKGVAGVMSLRDGSCPTRYREVEGVCAHERLLAMQSKRLFARTLADFKRGVTPPIVADAPAPPSRDPRLMDPGALVATKEDLEKRAAGRGISILEQFKDERAGNSRRPGRNASADERAGEGDQATSNAASLLSLLGDGQGQGQSQAGGGDKSLGQQLKQLDVHMDMLKDVQAMTADGEVSPQELQQIHEALGQSGSDLPLDQMIDTMLSGHGADLEGLGANIPRGR